MKKSFKQQINPAMQFITPQEEPGKATETPAKATDAPEGYKVNPLYIETKSRRLQLLVQPSLYERIKEKADAQGQSVNELIHTILEAWIRGEE